MSEQVEENSWTLLLRRSFGIPDIVTDPDLVLHAIGDTLLSDKDDDEVKRFFGEIENRDAELLTLLRSVETTLSKGRLNAWLIRSRPRPPMPILVKGTKSFNLALHDHRMNGQSIDEKSQLILNLNDQIVKKIEAFIRAAPISSAMWLLLRKAVGPLPKLGHSPFRSSKGPSAGRGRVMSTREPALKPLIDRVRRNMA